MAQDDLTASSAAPSLQAENAVHTQTSDMQTEDALTRAQESEAQGRSQSAEPTEAPRSLHGKQPLVDDWGEFVS